MFLIYAVMLGLLAGWVRGGQLKNLERLEIKRGGYAVTALVIQVVIFTPLSQIIPLWIIPLHMVSYLMIGVFLFYNLKLKGIIPVALGWAANFAAIAANGGYMPVDLNLISQVAPQSVVQSLSTEGVMNNSVLAGDASRLVWLGDIFSLPSWLPLANVFSLGDVFIAVGCLVVISCGMLDRPKSQAPAE